MKFALKDLARVKAASEKNQGPAAVATSLSVGRKRLGSKATRRIMDRLTAQQASLVRAISLDDETYLSRSFYTDKETGKRVAYELDEGEFKRYIAGWGIAPIECIRAMNRAIRPIKEPLRRERYVRAAVELEILMDQQIWSNGDGQVYRGIPSYLMNGYTDMGTMPSPTERAGREKIKVDKKKIFDRLVQCKREAVGLEKPGMDLLARFYDVVRGDIEFNERGVESLSREYGNESIVLSEYLDKGMGVCRHLSIFYQLYLQEAGIDSQVVKGNLRFYVFSGRHAWNVVEIENQMALVDVTHPNVNRPFILLGTPEAEVYERAKEYDRTYVATPDENNFYKIGV
jgi:hypothetical protein